MKDLNVKYLRILRLRFGLVEIVIFYAPAKKETVANASGSERCVLIPCPSVAILISSSGKWADGIRHLYTAQD